MNTVFIWNDRLYIEKLDRPLRFSNVEELLVILGHLLPRGGRLALVYEGEFVRAERHAVPQGDSQVIRKALVANNPDLALATAAWAFESGVADRGEEHFATIYSEASVKLRAIQEMLQDTHGITLECIYPMAALGSLKPGQPDRLHLTCVIGEDSAVLLGTSARGDRVSESVRGMAPEKLSAWVLQQARALGVCIQAASAMPSFITWIDLREDGQEDPMDSARKALAAQNRFSEDTLGGFLKRVHRLGKRHSTNLLSQSASVWDATPLLRWFAVAASLAALCGHLMWNHRHAQLEELRTNLVKETTVLREDIARRKQMSSEIQNLNLLYGEDAGWLNAPPKDLLTILGRTVPPAASLQQIHWNSVGGLSVTGRLLQTEHPGESDAWLESFVQTLSGELRGVRLPMDQIKMNRVNGMFSFVGNKEASL